MIDRLSSHWKEACELIDYTYPDELESWKCPNDGSIDISLPVLDKLSPGDVVYMNNINYSYMFLFSMLRPAILDYTPLVMLSCKGFPYVGVWSKPGAPFVCLEPWYGRSDNKDFAGDLSQKTGVQKLERDNVGFLDADGLAGSWGSNLAYKNDTVNHPRETVGLGIYVPRRYLLSKQEDENNYLYQMRPDKDGRLTYYFTFAAAGVIVKCRVDHSGYTPMENNSMMVPEYGQEAYYSIEFAMKKAE